MLVDKTLKYNLETYFYCLINICQQKYNIVLFRNMYMLIKIERCTKSINWAGLWAVKQAFKFKWVGGHVHTYCFATSVKISDRNISEL